MNVSLASPSRRRLRGAAAAVAVLSPVLSHIALLLGQGYGAALACAVAQAGATGLLLWSSLPVRRWLGPIISLTLLAALAAGARFSRPTALLAEAGVAHAILYAALLAVFAGTLRPGRVALVTWLASRLNPTFHAGQVPYTRAVTWAWVLFFAAQLVASAVLLIVDRGLWRDLVTTLHLPLVLAMLLAEAAIRRWRWRHEHATSLADTISGTRRLIRQWEASSSSTRS